MFYITVNVFRVYLVYHGNPNFGAKYLKAKIKLLDVASYYRLKNKAYQVTEDGTDNLQDLSIKPTSTQVSGVQHILDCWLLWK